MRYLLRRLCSQLETPLLPNLGNILVGHAPIQELGGSIDTGVLEMSNVNLADEFIGTILAQRGLQASSRVITVSDHMLELLRDLKQ